MEVVLYSAYHELSRVILLCWVLLKCVTRWFYPYYPQNVTTLRKERCIIQYHELPIAILICWVLLKSGTIWWWLHQMETFSALLAICAGNSTVNGEFPAQRPVMRSFDVFFDLRLNKWLGKQSWARWFETPSCPLWRHCNVTRTPQGD